MLPWPLPCSWKQCLLSVSRTQASPGPAQWLSFLCLCHRFCKLRFAFIMFWLHKCYFLQLDSCPRQIFEELITVWLRGKFQQARKHFHRLHIWTVVFWQNHCGSALGTAKSMTLTASQNNSELPWQLLLQTARWNPHSWCIEIVMVIETKHTAPDSS